MENENKVSDTSHEKKSVHEVESSDVLDCGEIIVINEVTAEGRQSIMAKLNAKPKDVKCRVRLTVKADTGANGNVLPIRCLKQMYQGEYDPCQRLKQSSVKLVAANGTKIDHLHSSLVGKFDRIFLLYNSSAGLGVLQSMGVLRKHNKDI